MSQSNSNKRALVTGASEGIGRAFAQQLASQGYRVTAVARNESRLKGLVAELGGDGHDYFVADLSRDKDVQRTADALQKGAYDLLINNAGFGVKGRFEEIELSELQGMTAVNIDALVALSHAYLKTARPGDALMNVSSFLSFIPVADLNVYCATKAFVTSFSEALWYQQKDRDVFVMALCPGATSTNFDERSGADYDKIPKAMIQTADAVVAYALKHLARRRKPTVISGFLNRFMGGIHRIRTRKGAVKTMSGMDF
ncbi:MAG: SDR family NAD(P)-dependent oxidoreductase [bacterium]|nr:SDR family NAD(P)-dependent oxidoreductase [bacterium]